MSSFCWTVCTKIFDSFVFIRFFLTASLPVNHAWIQTRQSYYCYIPYFFVELFFLFVCQFSFIVFCFNITGHFFFSPRWMKKTSQATRSRVLAPRIGWPHYHSVSQYVKKTPPHAHTRSLNGHFRTVDNYWKSVTQVPGKSPQTTSVMTGTEPNIPFAAINDVSGCCASYYYQSFV